MKRLFRKFYKVIESKNTQGYKCGKLIIKSTFLKNYITERTGNKIKVIVYGEKNGDSQSRY